MRLQTALLLSQLIEEQERREQRLKTTIVSVIFWCSSCSYDNRLIFHLAGKPRWKVAKY